MAEAAAAPSAAAPADETPEEAQERREQEEAREQARHRSGQRVLDMIKTTLPPEKMIAHLKRAPAHVIDYQNDGECGPIHACCWHNIPALGKVFIDAGCDVEKRMNGQTPLMMACSVGSIELVEMILEAGAYVNAVAPNGATALSEAINHPHILRKILEAGADRTIKKEGKTPLEQAREPGFMYGEARSVSLQILREYDQIDLLKKVAERRANEPKALLLGPKLWEACKAGQLEEANKLINEDADVLFPGDKGRSPLWIACRHGKTSCAALLLQSNALLDQIDEDGSSPLIAAAQNGKLECVELCVERGARINGVNKKGFTPLIAAIYNRHAHVANYLIEKGARVDVKAQGKTALEYAKIVVRAAPSEAAKKLVATIEEKEQAEVDAQKHLSEVMSRAGGAQVGPSQEAMAIS